MKRLCAPKSWMLNKLGGVFAPRPSSGPHKLRECLPLIILLRNKLRYALTRNEVTKITMQRVIRVDGKIRTDIKYPTGFMGMLRKIWLYYLFVQVGLYHKGLADSFLKMTVIKMFFTYH